MSALGQKQTSRVAQQMSALPPKADIDPYASDGRFVPIADSCTAANNAKLRNKAGLFRRAQSQRMAAPLCMFMRTRIVAAHH